MDEIDTSWNLDSDPMIAIAPTVDVEFERAWAAFRAPVPPPLPPTRAARASSCSLCAQTARAPVFVDFDDDDEITVLVNRPPRR